MGFHQDSQKILTLRKRFCVPVWDAHTREYALHYWQERGFHFDEPRGEEQIGRRGSVWGNLTSFDMSKLRATLTITTGRGVAGASIDDIDPLYDELKSPAAVVEFVLRVDTAMQHITQHNRAYWLLELETAESYLLHGDKQEVKWKQFDKQWRKAALYWAGTFTELPLDSRKQAPSFRSSLRLPFLVLLLGSMVVVPALQLRDRSLREAVQTGDVARAERLLQRGANIETVDPDGICSPRWEEEGYTPLALAIKRRDTPMIQMLLAHGASVRAKTKAQYGFEARDVILSTAVETGQTDVVRSVLDRGAIVDGNAGMRCTPLMLAARDNRLEIAKLLLAKGANVNARDDRGSPVLDFARDDRRRDHTAMRELLKAAGAR